MLKSRTSSTSTTCSCSSLYCFLFLILCSLFTYFLIQSQFQLKIHRKNTFLSPSMVLVNLNRDRDRDTKSSTMINVTEINSLFGTNFQSNDSISSIHLNLAKILEQYTHYSNDSTFNYTRKDVESMNNIVMNLKSHLKSSKLPRCDLISQKLIGYSPFNQTELASNITEEAVEERLSNQGIKFGGKWSPSYCESRYHVAILIPFLKREHHLKHFLLHMHQIFARQELSYGIYLIEPVNNVTFNRGALLNIGFIESNKDSNDEWQCHSYHDIDMISEDDRTLYSCPESPTHMSHRVSKFSYKPFYSTYFGGVSLIPKDKYIKSNGYSNLFFGWGGEDDDHYYRVASRGFKVLFPPDPYGRYLMMGHDPDKPNPERFKLMKDGAKLIDKEGLNTVKYKLIKIIKKPLYTKFLVYYNETELLNTNYTKNG